MKNLNYLNEYRIPLMGELGDEYNGMFEMKIGSTKYRIIAGNGGGWEHVSISNPTRVPSWSVMCKLKNMFFDEDETVVQYHPSKEAYVNVHPNCLHLWKPINQELPIPPKKFV